jgi:hypothetical protein
MKYLKKINEITSKYNKKDDRFYFNPADDPENKNTATFYLHKEKQGFAMDILSEDREKLEEILTRNNIIYTVSVEGNVLPF